MKSYRKERVAELKADIRLKNARAAGLMQRSARQNAPVRVSILRDSIKKGSDENAARVGTNVRYARFQEFGTGRYFKKGTPPDVNAPDKGQPRQTPWTYFDAELGEFRTTVGTQPHPFLWPAIKSNTAQLMAIYRKPMSTRSKARGTDI